MIHHTASSGSLASVELRYDGRTGLPGPPCHSAGTKDGLIYAVGQGRANHAGPGIPSSSQR
ncbi:N-acetylmuramoyl-L-alanine amidase [Streptomyces sp. WAC 06725]|uniref:N-acetylmuramoyl-L-alanine amidase n=1 Tax=Streptomyces sp. WAC 06725 TaxID=2203209 RepID=UPI0011CF24D4|nr:N-acetylmuramoyl-L-alanine amidase [Streptomyces sp. WAC 06725]